MEICLFVLFVLSLIYCCDIPVWYGFDCFVNNHGSLTYAIGVSVIASYIFYLIQVVIPKIMRFRRTRNIAVNRLYKIEQTMQKTLCCLQGVPFNSQVAFSKELIEVHLAELDKTDIFIANSECEIQNGKELSIFEAIAYYNRRIMELADEIIAGQYLERKYEKSLLSLKKMKLHEVIEMWMNNQPGEYERRNQNLSGYKWVNQQIVNSDIVSSVDEYIRIYKCIQEIRAKQYKKLHMPWNDMMNC